MAETITFRPNEDDRRRLRRISDKLTETLEKPTPSDCIRYALRSAEEKIGSRPKPRHPKPHR